MNIDGYNCPDNLYYHKEHMWLRVEGDLCVIGFNDFGQKLAGQIKRIISLEEEDEVEADKPFGTISTGKWSGKLYSPISGEIAQYNEELDEEPSHVNNDPYGKGWIIKVRPTNGQAEVARLMTTSDPTFAEWMRGQIVKYAKK
jgi:glycine cleavage system H protein